MKRSTTESLQSQIASTIESFFVHQPQESTASNLQSTSQKIECMKPNARAMRMMKRGSGRGFKGLL